MSSEFRTPWMMMRSAGIPDENVQHCVYGEMDVLFEGIGMYMWIWRCSFVSSALGANGAGIYIYASHYLDVPRLTLEYAKVSFWSKKERMVADAVGVRVKR